MIGIIDYEAGNIASVTNALSRLNVEFAVTNDTKNWNSATGISFQGLDTLIRL